MTTVTLAPVWPEELTEVFTSSQVCEYATLTRRLTPVTWPVTPYRGARTLDVSTGLSYPLKAERARANPRVALSYSDTAGYASGSASGRPPVVLVEGLATVRDADLQANTDRYVRESLLRNGTNGTPWFVARTWSWYYARIWVEVTPLRITWWPGGDLRRTPLTWSAEADVTAPPSDPAPSARPRRSAPPEGHPPADWRPFAERAARLGNPVLTMVRDGGPVPLRTRSVSRTDDGYVVTLPAGIEPTEGPVCLTFHRLTTGDRFAQENVVLLGHARPTGDGVAVSVDRAVEDWSVAGGRWRQARDWMAHGSRLKRRLADEARRRGQPVPKVRR
ncbi:MAG TPA: hypothetical protein VFT68_07690 [Lapillicoccus sp.]|nr:hypothetical protein [Lapillicoccus sp.]